MKPRSLLYALLATIVISFIWTAPASGASPLGVVHLDEVSTDCAKSYRYANACKVVMTVRLFWYANPTMYPPRICEPETYLTFFTFPGGVDVTADYRLTPDPRNPPELPIDGTPTELVYWVEVLPGATLGDITIDGKICMEPCPPVPGGPPVPVQGPCDEGATTTGIWQVNQEVAPDTTAPIFTSLAGRVGSSLEIADVNGDIWHEDLIVGAPYLIVGAVSEAGGVIVLESVPSVCDVTWPTYTLITEPTGPGTATCLSGTGPEVDAHFGHSVVAGDFDGDGLVDIAVGAPLATAGSVLEGGEVYVFWNEAVGAPWASYCLLQDPFSNPGAHFGHSLAAGTFDGFAGDDLAVGEPGYSVSPGNREGRVKVYTTRGARLFPGVLSGTLTHTAAPGPTDNFGISVAAGNVYNQQLDQVIAGAPDAEAGSRGAVYIFANPLASPPPTGIIPAPLSGGDLEWDVASGNVNGDNFDDVAVGDTFWPRVSVYAGDTFAVIEHLEDTSTAIPGTTDLDLDMGDIDGDGKDDVIVGYGERTVCGQNRAGEVFAWTNFGNTDTRYFFEGRPQEDPESEAALGHAVAVGELNGDPACVAWGEVAVGIPEEDSDLVVDPGRVIVLLDDGI